MPRLDSIFARLRSNFSKQEQANGGAILSDQTGTETMSGNVFDMNFLRCEYHRVSVEFFSDVGIQDGHMEIKVRNAGITPDGVVLFSVFVKVVKWDSNTMPLTLANLPIVEYKLRKKLRADVDTIGHRFAGLWLHVAADLKDRPTTFVKLDGSSSGGTSPTENPA